MEDLNMRIGRLAIASIAVTVFGALFGGLTCGHLFTWVYEVEPTTIWRDMEGPPGPLFFVGALVCNIIFVAVYALLVKGLPGKNRLVKGLVFGLCVWAVGMLPGMLSTYSFMVIAPTVVIYWAIMGLIHYPLNGLIAAAIYGE